MLTLRPARLFIEWYLLLERPAGNSRSVEGDLAVRVLQIGGEASLPDCQLRKY